jgi:hypothetical protein
MSEKQEFMSYVSRCKGGCGALVFAMVDDPRFSKDTAKEVAKLIKAGYTVERTTTADVRAAVWGCRCEKEGGTQIGLFK